MKSSYHWSIQTMRAKYIEPWCGTRVVLIEHSITKMKTAKMKMRNAIARCSFRHQLNMQFGPVQQLGALLLCRQTASEQQSLNIVKLCKLRATIRYLQIPARSRAFANSIWLKLVYLGLARGHSRWKRLNMLFLRRVVH